MTLFLPFAELCDALAATTKKLEKRNRIASYLQSLPVDDAGRAALWLSGTPFAETDHRVLNIGGSLLSKAVAQLTAATPAALSAAYRRHGDFGAATADLLLQASQSHAPTTAKLTLADVQSAFANLAAARGPAPKLRLLVDLLGHATPLEAKYLIKLATGDMRTGVKQSLVEEAIAEAWPVPPATPSVPAHAPEKAAGQAVVRSSAAAPAAQINNVRRASMLLGSLPEVVALAAAGHLDQARMKLLHPIGFMLASPVQSVEEALTRFTEEIAAETHAPVILSQPRSAAKRLAKDPDNFPSSSGALGSPPPTRALTNPTPPKNPCHPEERNDEGPRVLPAPPPIPVILTAAKDPDDPPSTSTASASPPPALTAAQIEDKYDGIRAQLHIDGPRVALYSRNRDDLSAAFPDLVEAFAAIGESVILDGEILAWNPAARRALPFSALQQRLGRKRVSQEMLRDIPAVLIVFDILYRGETLLLEQPLIERRRHLEDFAARWSLATVARHARGQSSLFAEKAEDFPRLILASATHLATAQQLDQAYLDARARGNEGVMIKSLASLYQPGRRGLAWLKLKRELATLDVVVTGVEYGNGRRAAVLSDYTFAVRDLDDPAQPLKNVGKAYSGLTDAEITEMTAFFKAHTLEDNGHFRTVEPQVVLEVAFNNVMRSDRHASGFALRFPRILRIRTDKPVSEIDTLQRVEEIYNAQPDKPEERETSG